MNDVISVLNWIDSQNTSYQKIHLIGHSRGGGIALLAANMDNRISSVTSWAGISDIGSRFPSGKELDEWKNSGVRYVQNGRTKQNLPQFYSLYEDFNQNQDKLNIGKACETLKIPACIIHGSNDTSVPLCEGEKNAKLLNVPLQIIENADHVFGASHPWKSSDLPKDLKIVCMQTLENFNNLLLT